MFKEFKTLARGWEERRREEKTPKSMASKVITICQECYTFYYDNSWHFEKPDNLELRNGSEVPINLTQCSACLEQEIAAYDMESELVWRKV